MMNSIKRFVRLQIKQTEFRYNTWRNQRLIHQAYRTTPDINRIYRQTRRLFLGVLLVAGAILLCGLLWIGGEKIGKRILATRALQPAPIPIREPVATPESAIPAPALKPAPDSIAAAIKPAAPDVTPPQPAEERGAETWHIPQTTEHCIVANKADGRMYLLGMQGGALRRVREFSMACGRNGGPKIKQGDKRTPEGIYFIIGRKEGFELPAIYGPLVFVLDYPNPEDRKAGRTGNGIWIHGTAPDSVPVDTRGCLELRNEDVRELGKLLRFGIGTPVVIVFDPSLTNPEALAADVRIQSRRREVVAEYIDRQSQFIHLLVDWKSSWEARDLSRYTEFYDTGRFTGQGMRWTEWAERKRKIFESGASIAITLDSILLVDCSEGAAEVVFLQDYRTNALASVNGKKLSFVKYPDAWKIVRESTFPKEELSL
jgi:murein L,D-transpeptidase YafK